MPSRAQLTVEAGAYRHPGSAAGPAPMELMLASLVTCAGSTICAVLSKMRFQVDAINVVADAIRSDDVPRVYTQITLEYQVATDAPDDRLERALRVTARTCSASSMLAKATRLDERMVVVRPVEAAATRPLRQRVLRPHQSLEELAGSAEEPDATVWLGAMSGDDVVGTAGLVPEPCPDAPAAGALRLRAMATDESFRGRGLGQVILRSALAEARRAGVEVVWCSARTPARSLYLREGFVETSDVYEVDHIGPHVRMVLRTTP